MKNVRIVYKKVGDARFVSHLDMNRYFARILRKADLPLWFTEGFNPHIYTNFAFPLSLGFESEGEILDVRLVEDFPLDVMKDKINAISPEILQVVDVFEPKQKFTEICFAEYKIHVLSENDGLYDALNEFLNSKEILVTRTNKKGVQKQVDLVPDITAPKILKIDGGAELRVILPAGNAKTVNPTLLMEAFAESYEGELDMHYTRIGFLDKELKKLA